MWCDLRRWTSDFLRVIRNETTPWRRLIMLREPDGEFLASRYQVGYPQMP
jgi:hypothetical protein